MQRGLAKILYLFGTDKESAEFNLQMQLNSG